MKLFGSTRFAQVLLAAVLAVSVIAFGVAVHEHVKTPEHRPHLLAKVMVESNPHAWAWDWADNDGATLWLNNPDSLREGEEGVVLDRDSVVYRRQPGEVPLGVPVLVVRVEQCQTR